MSHPQTLPRQQITRAVAVLSHPGLIRLVSEIDDNGPVQHRMLGRTFADLARHQIRHAFTAGRDHGLIYAEDTNSPCYLLTHSGADLADVYDQAARWARAHNYPSATGDFVTRVRETLVLLGREQVIDAMTSEAGDEEARGQVADAGLLPTTEAVAELHRPWAALSRWTETNPSVLTTAARRSCSTAEADAEPAA
ncbi:hypothetical protein ABZ769_33805 [Streptomyces olivoreticuli]